RSVRLLSPFFFSLLFFFFQAEDGIRDFHVTGVQTCALPICAPRERGDGITARLACAGARRRVRDRGRRSRVHGGRSDRRDTPVLAAGGMAHERYRRSEERRVGKECRSRWTTYHYRMKTIMKTLHVISKD